MSAADSTTLLDRLRTALRTMRSPYGDVPLEPMADKGLAHHHVRLLGTGVIARLPKQSQMGLAARDNLDYQAACYQRASATGAAPRLVDVMPPSDALPRGGLLVQEIVGRAARLPDDLPALARALAAIHTAPLPAATQRAPLRDDTDPLRALRDEIETQAVHLDGAALHPASRQRVDALRAALLRLCARPQRPPKRLISFDAHPGNFLVCEDGRAVLVDLEKARYSHPPLDLAHATLYTSTTWDVDVYAELTLQQVADTYAAWSAHIDDATAYRPWLVPLRAAMWLWSLTWCAKWRVLSPRAARSDGAGEDWSSARSGTALIAHVRDRVDCYLSAPIIERIVDEFAALESLPR